MKNYKIKEKRLNDFRKLVDDYKKNHINCGSETRCYYNTWAECENRNWTWNCEKCKEYYIEQKINKMYNGFYSGYITRFYKK